jgi:membrane protease YdiL (CAAX protease family)
MIKIQRTLAQIGRILRERNLTSYFVLAYAISWILWTPIVFYYMGHEAEHLPELLLILGWIGSFGPTASAIILTGIETGFEGVRSLALRFAVWRVDVHWYLFIVLFPAFTRLTSIVVYALVTGVKLEPDLSQLPMAISFFLMAFPFGPLAEEAGWRGYALPRLQASHGFLGAGLIVGVLWTLWHVPGFFVPGMVLPSVPLDWAVVLNYTLRVVSISVLFAWVYNNTKGSLLVSTIFHAALNSMPATTNRVFFMQQSVEIINWINWLVAGLNWMTIIIVLFFFKGAEMILMGKT